MAPSGPRLLTALALAGPSAACAASSAVSVPPVVDLPVAPAPSPRATTERAAAPAPPRAPPEPWVARFERSEKTTEVMPCQIPPATAASAMVVEARWLSAGKLALRVVQDDERSSPGDAPVSLLGKGYVVEGASREAHVADGAGAPVPDDDAARVRTLVAAMLDWPGAQVAAHPPAAGAEVPALAEPVVRVAAVSLREEPAQESRATVRFASTRAGDEGGELLFDVTVSASAFEAGMCHQWISKVDTHGQLRLRASDGALLELHLEGPSHNTEGLCQRADGSPGKPAPPHLCNKGQVTVEVHQPHVVASPK